MQREAWDLASQRAAAAQRRTAASCLRVAWVAWRSASSFVQTRNDGLERLHNRIRRKLAVAVLRGWEEVASNKLGLRQAFMSIGNRLRLESLQKVFYGWLEAIAHRKQKQVWSCAVRSACLRVWISSGASYPSPLTEREGLLFVQEHVMRDKSC